MSAAANYEKGHSMWVGSSSGRMSKGWRDFLLVRDGLLKAIGRAVANKAEMQKS